MIKKFQYPVGDGTRQSYERDWYVADVFGKKRALLGGGDYYHGGIDINLKTGGNTDKGKPLYACSDWKLVYYHVGSHVDSGFGIHLVYEVESPWGKRWIHYAHCDKVLVNASPSTSGVVGDKIATIGNTGRPFNVMSAHLHMSVYKKDPGDLPSGIDSIAKSVTTLKEWWEDPTSFMDNWYNESMKQDPEEKVTVEQIIIDGYLALCGEGPSDAEKAWRLESWENSKVFIESLTGDNRFYQKYVQPHVTKRESELESAYTTERKKILADWQSEVKSVKSACAEELKKAKAKGCEGLTWAEHFEMAIGKLLKKVGFS